MIVAAVLAADIAATIDLSDHSEVRVRTTQETPAPPPTNPPTPPVGLDVMTQPAAQVHVYDRRWDLTLGYDVRLLAADVELGLSNLSALAMQTGTAGVSWHDRRLRLTLLESAAYGLQNSAYLGSTASSSSGTTSSTSSGATAQPPPAGQGMTPLVTALPETILSGLSRTTIGAVYRLDRRTTLAADAQYFVTGGLTATAQEYLPLQTGQNAVATLEHRVTRSNAVVTTATAEHVDFSPTQCATVTGTSAPALTCQPSDDLVNVVQRLRTTLSRRATVTLGIGAAFAAVREQSNVGYSDAFYPVADAAYSLQLDRESKLAFTGTLSPYVNPLTGVALNAIQGDATFTGQLSRPVVLTASAGGSQNVPPNNPAATSVLRADVAVEYRFGPELVVAVGERAFWESTNLSGDFVTTVGYVAVTVSEPRLHF